VSVSKITFLALITLLITAIFLLTGCASLQYYEPMHRWNVYQQRWELASPKAEMRYNSFENEFRYVE
jgi:outer membrane biogenesis lipoprotein LolB